MKPLPPGCPIEPLDENCRTVGFVVGAAESLKMPKKKPPTDTATATAADIEKSIQALNKMAERLWGDGREAEAKALLDALDALNRALDRIRIGESRRAVTLH